MSYFWENDKVELRLVRETDVDFFYDLLQNTRIRMQANHGISLPSCIEQANDMTGYAIECNENGNELWFLIQNREEEQVGYAVVDWMNEKAGTVQLHITVLEQFQRNGYGTAVASILLQYLFEERRFEKVGCNLMENQIEYREFIRKLGFRTDAHRKELFFMHGSYIGEYYFSLLRSEYFLWKKGKLQLEEKEADNSDFLQEIQDETADAAEKIPFYDKRDNFWSYDRITLREMRREDYLKNHEMIFDTQSCIMYDSEVKLPDLPEELYPQEEAHLALQNEDNRIEFAIDNENGEYVGNINLCGMDHKNGKFSFSIYLLPEFRKKGYGKKALILVMTYCFEELRMHKMISCVNDGNASSAALMRSVGCQVEGVLRHEAYYHGAYVDVILYGVTREAFLKKFTKG